MNHIKTGFTAFLLVVLSVNLYCEKVSVPGDFLGFGLSARSNALGNAFTSISDDTNALVFNPSGLSQIERPMLSAFYAPLFFDTHYSAFEFAIPTRKFGVLGFGGVNLSSDGFEERISPQDAPDNFRVAEQAGIIGYSMRVIRFVSVGLNAKALSKKVYNCSDTAFGADFGFLIKDFAVPEKGPIIYSEPELITHLKRFSFGVCLQNLVPPKFKMKSEEEKYPYMSRWGLSYCLPLKDKDKFVLSYDLEKKPYPKNTNHIGVEYLFGRFLALRVGYSDDVLNTGFGLNFDNYFLDYAVAAHDLGLNQRFSFRLRFGHTMEELESMRKENIEKMTRKKAEMLSQEYYLQGMDKYNRKIYKEAIKDWEKAVIWEPGNYKAEEMTKKTKEILAQLEAENEYNNHLLMAHALYSQNELTQSLEEWEWIKNKEPDNKDAEEYIKKIKEKISLSAVERAKFEREKKSRKEGKIAMISEEGWQYFKQADYKKAIDTWQRVFAVDYDHKKTLDNIALARKQLRDDIEKKLGMGMQYYREKKYARAVACFQEVLKLDPENSSAAQSLEMAKKEVSSRQEAEPVDRKLIDRMYFSAVDYYLQGYYEEAQKVLEMIKIKDPLNNNAYKLEERIEKITEKINGDNRQSAK